MDHLALGVQERCVKFGLILSLVGVVTYLVEI